MRSEGEPSSRNVATSAGLGHGPAPSAFSISGYSSESPNGERCTSTGARCAGAMDGRAARRASRRRAFGVAWDADRRGARRSGARAGCAPRPRFEVPRRAGSPTEWRATSSSTPMITVRMLPTRAPRRLAVLLACLALGGLLAAVATAAQSAAPKGTKASVVLSLWALRLRTEHVLRPARGRARRAPRPRCRALERGAQQA